MVRSGDFPNEKFSIAPSTPYVLLLSLRVNSYHYFACIVLFPFQHCMHQPFTFFMLPQPAVYPVGLSTANFKMLIK